MKDKELRMVLDDLGITRNKILIGSRTTELTDGLGYMNVLKDLARLEGRFGLLQRELRATQELLNISHIMPLMRHESLKKGKREVEI